MTGWLIYDRVSIIRNQGFADMLTEYAKKTGIELILKFDDDIIFNPLPDFVIMRSYNFSISARFEELGVRVFNNSNVSEICNDKYKTYKYFINKNIPMMETKLFEDKIKLPFRFPFVVKPVDGHGGKGVTLISNDDEFNSFKIEGKMIAQKFASNKGKDLRVYIMGNKILKGMLRVSETDFRSNFSLGGKAYIHELTAKEKAVIDKVLSYMSFDFAGIDLIYHKGNPVLNEIEDVVGSRMLYSYTDIDAGKEYIDYIKNEL